ncbi:MCM DNA helicase complex subunit, partial [Coemansia sp. RSA 2681]
TLIRLATAHAKVRLSPTVDAQDAEVAKALLRFALFKDSDVAAAAAAAATKASSRRKPKRVRTASNSDDDEEEEDVEEAEGEEKGAADSGDDGLRPMQTAAAFAAIALNDDADADESMDVDIPAARLALFKAQLSRAIADRRLDTSDSPWSFPDPFMSAINFGLDAPAAFSIREVEAALLDMQNANRLMFRDNMVIMM